MGRKYPRAGKYLYLCLTGLILFSFWGCATVEGIVERRAARQGLQRGQALFARGAYQASLRETQQVYSMAGTDAPGDEAIFTMGLIYVHDNNPEKNYDQAIGYFNTLIEDYPQSPLVEQARMWVNALNVIEQGKRDALERQKQDNAEKLPKKIVVQVPEQAAPKHLVRSQQLLAEGNYKEALRESEKLLSLGDKSPCADKALFQAGLINAHYENPEKDYNEAIRLFNKIIAEYPRSPLVEQAKLWVGTLDIIEKEKQVDIEIEKKKQELERQVVEQEEVPPAVEPDTTVSQPAADPAGADSANQASPVQPGEKTALVTVLEDEGGSLYFVARNHYKKTNETLYEIILQANPFITDVRDIDDAQEIIVPIITAESYIKKVPGDEYRVYVGTFATYALATAYSQKVESPENLLFIDAHEFSPQDTWYRVTMGDFKTKEEALDMVSRLAARGLIYIPPQPDLMENGRVDTEKEEKKSELHKQE